MNKSNEKIQVVGGKPAWDEELRLWLESYIKAHPHLTPAILQQKVHVGFSRTGIDAYLKCTYFAAGNENGKGVKRSDIEPLIRSYRERVEGTSRHGTRNNFLKTTAWVQFQNAVQTSIEEHAIVVVYSAPGEGKSRCMIEYAVQKMTTMPVQILCSRNITTRYFVQKIAKALDLADNHPTARLEDSIAAQLKRHPRPIFVDQANYLNERALGSVCYIWEVARTPIVLIGTQDLKDLFTSSSMTQDVRAQLTSRIAMHYPLDGLSQAQVKAIVKSVLGDRATDEVCSQIFNVTRGNHRAVEFIFPRIKQLMDMPVNTEKPMEEIIAAAGSRLMVA